MFLTKPFELDDVEWLRPISFFSRCMSKAEMNYSTFDQEFFAIILVVMNFKHYFDSAHFNIM